MNVGRVTSDWLAKLLQEGYGVGLNGVILISPALEWALLDPSDYDALHWVDTFPTMALAAGHHGKSRVSSQTVDELKQKAEAFATTELTPYLVQGERCPSEQRRDVLTKIADFLGLEQAFVDRFSGRVPIDRFCREGEALEGVGEVDRLQGVPERHERPRLAEPGVHGVLDEGKRRVEGAAIRQHLWATDLPGNDSVVKSRLKCYTALSRFCPANRNRK